MKKLFIISALLIANALNAHSLKDAIKDSNLIQAQEELAKNPQIGTQKKSLLELAQNIKKLRFETHIAGEEKFGLLSSPTSEILVSTKIGLGLMGAFIALASFSKAFNFDVIQSGLKHDLTSNSFSEVNYVVCENYSLPALAIGLPILYAIKNWLEARELKQRYFDALAIEELVSNI